MSVTDDDASMIRQELGRLNLRISLLEQIQTPLIGAILADLSQHGSPQDMLLRIQDIRRRVRQDMRANAHKANMRPEIVAELQLHVDGLLDRMVEMVSDVAFEDDSGKSI